VKLLLHWRSSKEDYNKLMLEKLENELRFLKTQLNPHFLFNTLNNLYYLTLEKSDLAPKAVLQLSEILDYVLHTAKDNFVPIEQEWRQLENYIQLESLHYQGRISVETTLTGATPHHFMPPMVLMTLLENAFKHGVGNSKGKSWIKLKVECGINEILISLHNLIGERRTIHGGIGLSNLRGQLDMLYPGRYQIIIDNQNQQEFFISLRLKTNS
jgi:LytS/YehU family sensor histidine kinase